MSYATPGTPTGPVGVNVSGDVSFRHVATVVSGQGAYEGYGLLMKSLIGTGAIDPADFGVVESSIAGWASTTAEQVVLDGELVFSGFGEINGAAMLRAVGDAPDPCPGNVNGDGSVSTRDVLAFLNAWAADDPAADRTARGSSTPGTCSAS